MQKCAEDPKERMTTPQADGFFMPGEYEPHDGCILIWPSRPGSWIYGARDARIAFRDVIAAIAQSENVYVAAGRDAIDSAREMLTGGDAPWKKRVTVFELETDDAWARDVAPTFVKDGAGRMRAVNWSFNAWGGSVDGLYASWALDDAFAKAFAAKYGYACYDASPFVLEGGSIHSDGEGTLLVTEACLLSAGRNPGLTREEIEEKLRTYLGIEKVLWLPRGIYQDETNEHVDNVCAVLRARWCLPGRTMKQIPSIRYHSRRLRTWRARRMRAEESLSFTSFRFPIIRSALQRRNWQVIRLPKGRMSGRRESVLRHPT